MKLRHSAIVFVTALGFLAVGDARAGGEYAEPSPDVADLPAAAPFDGPADGGETKADSDWRDIAPNLRLGGSLRFRYEHRRNSRFDSETDDYLLSQLRVNLRWEPLEWLAFYVEGQGAEIQGERQINEDARPTIFKDDFDLHQGYVEFKGDFGMPIRVRVGRQKINLGDQRLVSALEWVNTARMFDAARVTLGEEKVRTAELIVSRHVAIDPDAPNDWSKTGNRLADSDFHVFEYRDHELIPNSSFATYAMLRRETDANDQVYTVGGSFETSIGVLGIDAEGAFQFGEYGGLTQQAFFVHAGVGLDFDVLSGLHIGTAYNYGSGDSDPDDSKHETFDNLYPLNHAYYGYMDFFGLQNLHNLEAVGWAKPLKWLTLRLAYQAFWLDEPETDNWYNAGLGVKRAGTDGANSFVGSEIDFTIKYGFWKKRVWLEAGYSHFFAADFVDDTGPSNDADFVYLQTKMTW